MLDTVFRGLFDTALTDTIFPGNFLICVAVSLVLGLLLCAMTGWQSHSSRSFAITLALLPAVVCVVIMMVNGNVGTGVAVAGSFSLVRYRKLGTTTPRAYAALFALILGAATMAYTAFSIRPHSGGPVCRTLHITVPEDLDYIGVFEPVLDEYTRQYSLTQVKTTNMGSLFKLTYDVTMKDAALEKKFIDQLRLRNGNLEIALGHQDNAVATL